MKTCISLITGIIILAGISISNSSYAGDFGLRAGYHSASLHSADDGKIEKDLGSFYVGFFKDNNIVPIVNWGLGLEYFQNGSKTDNDNKLVMHTVSIPLYLKAKVGPVYATGGTGFNFLLSENLFVDGEKIDLPSDQESKKFDMPVHLGIGVSFLMLSVEARYHWGLMEINDNGKVKNKYLQIGAALSF